MAEPVMTASGRSFRLVVVESPYRGDVKRNMAYLRAAMQDCLSRNEAPFASHAMYAYSGVLDDAKPDERSLGIEAGFAWGRAGARSGAIRAFYIDLGWSKGMQMARDEAQRCGQVISIRRVEAWGDGDDGE